MIWCDVSYEMKKKLYFVVSGRERFRFLTRKWANIHRTALNLFLNWIMMFDSYFRHADGVVLVYDVNRKITFDNIENWYQEVKNLCRKGVKIILGNYLFISLWRDNRNFRFKQSALFQLVTKMRMLMKKM